MVAKRKTEGEQRSRPEHWDRGLSPKQQAIFAFVRRYFVEHGKGPTALETFQALGDLTDSAVRHNLKALERVDYLRSEGDKGVCRWPPTGERALAEAHLWRLVDDGIVTWAGGKPKGSVPPIRIQGDGYVSDFVHQDRR
jgi:SOS-response transcriptional repressor LexA